MPSVRFHTTGRPTSTVTRKLIPLLCRLDDPVVWGILPFRYLFDPSNLRWTLGAADICFANK